MAKNGAVKMVIGVVISLVLAGFMILGWGIAFGGIRGKVTTNANTSKAIQAVADTNKEAISVIKEEQAYQKGVVNTKLDNLDKGQRDIMEIIQKWEPR